MSAVQATTYAAGQLVDEEARRGSVDEVHTRVQACRESHDDAHAQHQRCIAAVNGDLWRKGTQVSSQELHDGLRVSSITDETLVLTN